MDEHWPLQDNLTPETRRDFNKSEKIVSLLTSVILTHLISETLIFSSSLQMLHIYKIACTIVTLMTQCSIHLSFHQKSNAFGNCKQTVMSSGIWSRSSNFPCKDLWSYRTSYWSIKVLLLVKQSSTIIDPATTPLIGARLLCVAQGKQKKTIKSVRFTPTYLLGLTERKGEQLSRMIWS